MTIFLESSLEVVQVSKKYRLLIPERLRLEAGIKPGDKMVALLKNGILQYVPVRPLKSTRGIIKDLDTRRLRDKSDRF